MNELPPDFDGELYRRTYTDLHGLGLDDLEDHYWTFGVMEGRSGSSITNRASFVALLDSTASILEIGPLASPAAIGPNVRYFDVLPTSALKEKAKLHGLDPDSCPSIDFVSETADLSIVTTEFDAVVSSHAIEHQPDLVRHLNGVARILRPRGLYFLVVPDKRYCFDHFIAESSIADVLGASLRRRKLHNAVSVIRQLALTTHNDAGRHWRGDHGEPLYKSSIDALRGAVQSYLISSDTYIDAHAWHFTPESFRGVLQTLFDLGVSPFKPVRVYHTVFGAIEFYAVLEKCTVQLRPLGEELPHDFDAALYLAANPDVARSGMDAALHYLSYGRDENRKLRP
ncbi:MAG: methyltransferase domain-containing protein [Rhodanobacteraceae bacterium]